MPANRAVRDVLQREHLVTAPPEMTVRDAARAMAQARCGSILVMQGTRLLGIFTERDLMNRVMAADRDPDRTPIGQVMTADPDTIDAASPVRQAIRMMHEFGYRHLPVLDGAAVIGVLSIRALPMADLAAMQGEIEQRDTVAATLR